MNTKLRIQDHILFLGNRSDVNRLYQAMDVFVLTSRYEGLPVVGIEAQAEGLPCVFSDKITREIQITENAVFKSLDESPCTWAKAIIECKDKTRVTHDSIEKYDIAIQAEILAHYYSGLMNSL